MLHPSFLTREGNSSKGSLMVMRLLCRKYSAEGTQLRTLGEKKGFLCVSSVYLWHKESRPRESCCIKSVTEEDC